MPTIADWLMIAITTVYVIATILICFFNSKSVEFAQRQVAAMQEQHAEDNKPVLAVYPLISDKKLCFEIKNIGSRKALNIDIDFPSDNILPDLKNNLDAFMRKLKGKDIELMPQQSVFYVLEHLTIPQSALETLKRMGTIYLRLSFQDGNGNTYNSKQIADTSLLQLHYTVDTNK